MKLRLKKRLKNEEKSAKQTNRTVLSRKKT